MNDEDDMSQEATQMNREQEYDMYRTKGTKKQGIVSAVILGLILIGLFLAMYFSYELAKLLQPGPKVFLSPSQYGFRESNKRVYKPNNKRKTTSQQIQNLYKVVEIDQPHPLNLATVEQTNMAHIMYRRTMLDLDTSHIKAVVQSYSQEPITTQSRITYDQYLQAVELLRLSTSQINHYSPGQIQLKKQENIKYQKKYGKLSAKRQLQICLILLLTRSGLQSSDYFYALKSIFQQQYNNFNVIIINNTPQMNMDSDVVNLVKEISEGRATIISKISPTDQINEGSFVYHALHRYCSLSDLTIIMRDSGQLIGTQVFSLLNKFHIQKQAPLIFTSYLLEMGRIRAQIQDDYRYKVQIYPKLADYNMVRSSPYKTKYLKSYSTKLLLSLPLNAFVTSEERRDNSLFQANLQFAAFELACGEYFLLEEILYKTTKGEVQTYVQIEEARKHEKLQCQKKGMYKPTKH